MTYKVLVQKDHFVFILTFRHHCCHVDVSGALVYVPLDLLLAVSPVHRHPVTVRHGGHDTPRPRGRGGPTDV